MTTPMNPYAKKPVIRVDNKAMFATIRFPALAEGKVRLSMMWIHWRTCLHKRG